LWITVDTISAPSLRKLRRRLHPWQWEDILKVSPRLTVSS
jgi:hypothetical protein